ncbi:MAG: hypothetical protein IJV33_01810 [Bacteroidaceae bacterium]|nr:hypothetical protein [Bacteroidaceae bacterium]
MKKIFFLTAWMAVCGLSMAQAQETQNRTPRMEWFESVKSPEISPEGDVTFRLFAPQAKKVELSSQFCPNTPMVKDEASGLWKVTLHPEVADIYPYNFVVDGQQVSDPNNKEVFPNELFKASLLVMPNPDMLYTERNIPHGKVHYCNYYSTVLKENRRLLVYTPADYDRDAQRHYPVFYLVSGTTDTEETWYKAGRTNDIMDNLIQSGKANKMIVVMPYGNMNTGNPRPSSPEATKCYEIFSQEMKECIMPYVEKNFRTKTERENRAIAGFSRGGGEALYTAFRLSDQFASVCAYSAYLTNEVYEQQFGDLINHPDKTNDLYRLIWFGVGSSDFLLEGVHANEALFQQKGIRFEQFDTTGGHTWMNARKFLGLTAPKLFKVQNKVVEEGGAGAYKAVVESEETLPDFTIYRPQDMLAAVKAEGKLPVLLFANGACMDSSVGYENMLNHIASHGYMVVAIGELQQKQFDRNENSTQSEMLDEALQWVLRQAKTKGCKYYGLLDPKKIAAGGHSCGGAQTLYNCGNPNIKTCIIFNAGMGKMSMAGASPASLLNLHQPILYMTGGTTDVAYQNAQIDYESISKVPVVLADNTQSGHGGTYGQPHGGSNAVLALRWLDWQLKGKKANASTFLKPDLTDFDGWTIKSKGF